MPKSTTPVESQLYELLVPQIENVRKEKPNTTVKMVQQALLKLHNVKGSTLKQIYGYILDKFDLKSISNVRTALIKKYLKSLCESEDVVNITGRGLSGHFKLADKQRFSKQIMENEKNKSKTRAKSKSKTNNGTLKRKHSSRATKGQGSKKKSVPSVIPDPPIIQRQATPIVLPQNTSIFDTPMVRTQGQASTPFINSQITYAPEVRKGVHKKKLPLNDNGTPRSSIPGKRRKLRNSREK